MVALGRVPRRLHATLMLSMSTKRSSAGHGCRQVPDRCQGLLPCLKTVSGNQLSRIPSWFRPRHVRLPVEKEGQGADDGLILRPVSLGSFRLQRRCPSQPKPGLRSEQACRVQPPRQDMPDLQATTRGAELSGACAQWHTPG